jgi:hypothetical protein
MLPRRQSRGELAALARLASRHEECGDGCVGVVWHRPLLGAICLVDCVVFVDLVLADWRERRATRKQSACCRHRRDMQCRVRCPRLPPTSSCWTRSASSTPTATGSAATAARALDFRGAQGRGTRSLARSVERGFSRGSANVARRRIKRRPGGREIAAVALPALGGRAVADGDVGGLDQRRAGGVEIAAGLLPGGRRLAVAGVVERGRDQRRVGRGEVSRNLPRWRSRAGRSCRTKPRKGRPRTPPLRARGSQGEGFLTWACAPFGWRGRKRAAPRMLP